MFLKNWLSNEPKPTIFCTVVSAAALIFSLGRWLNTALPFDPAWIAIFLCGIPIVTGAANALIREHDVKADMLVSIALIASVFTREYFAAGEVALIMQIGSLLEDFTANRARRGIEGLIRMTPKTARLHRNGTSVIVPVEELKVGDIITVLAGETIPTDGVLTHGESSIDQSAMTGESIPVDKKAGDSVLSGTVNQYGTFEMKASKVCSDSSLQRMIALAEAADAGKAPIVSLADKWAGWMVFAALGCAALTWLLTGQFLRAVTVLVVFCPCAFILATPTAVAAAIGNLTRYGILIRTGDGLERLAAVDTVALDKTGTLTCGKPVVTSVETFDDSFSPADILKLAASCEQCSEHPLGKAIVSRFTEQGGLPEKATDIKILAGRGVRAQINGHTVIVGKPGLSDSDNLIGDSASATVSDNKSVIPLFPTDESHAALVQSCYDHGATVIFVSVDGKAAGMVALADTVRSCSRETVEQLKAEQLTPVLLTGDNPAAAGTVARSLGISEYRSSLLPADKMTEIRDLENSGRKVCMVGDGINDAPALKSAWAGIAMGGIGSDIAMESADAVLVSDDIQNLPYLFYLTRKSMTKIRQNIIISMAINFTAILLSAGGFLVPVTAALVHNFGSVFVVINAAMLLREKKKDPGSLKTGTVINTIESNIQL